MSLNKKDYEALVIEKPSYDNTKLLTWLLTDRARENAHLYLKGYKPMQDTIQEKPANVT